MFIKIQHTVRNAILKYCLLAILFLPCDLEHCYDNYLPGNLIIESPSNIGQLRGLSERIIILLSSRLSLEIKTNGTTLDSALHFSIA